MRIRREALAAFVLLPCLAGSALAQDRGREGHREGGGRAEWHGEIARFHEHDIERWRGGRWFNGRHEGRLGWWWIVGGAWYFYPVPVDPYPDPYQPPVVVLPPPAETPHYWYYCANPAGYYPYVAQCTVNWKRVPATVPPGAPSR